ncbi:EAL domain-containing protein [Variovorax ginsengisoli]|uniref:cyclic-guanylate-specific phosphodiesterase n=1 Tax=Variovorax ginsengisoli TaxID=363844 RepID=A0ABT9S7L4_9BURK|nr:EAL domain-containing protein [Variovorax ginsengisoli]MDP9899884.1 sensor c-di-GMP phosphodiesterase-like protein [Variovorax ginsengisoli]
MILPAIDLRSKLANVALLFASAMVITACMLLAAHMAELRGRHDSAEGATRIVAEVLRKAQASSADVDAIINIVSRTPVHADACSEQGMLRLRQADAASLFASAVGRIQNGRLMCSSLGLYGPGLLLDAATTVSSTGLRIHTGMSLPGMEGHKYLAAERDGVIVFIDEAVTLDIFRTAPDVALGMFLRTEHRRLIGRGDFNPAWASSMAQQTSATFVDGDYVVAMHATPEHDVVAYVAFPRPRTQTRIDEARLFLLPIGALFGVVLSACLWLLSRLYVQKAADFRYALQSPQVFMQYQPIVDLRSGRCIGAEALMRWQRGKRMVPPDHFIAAAEKAGFIERVTERVVQLVARDAAVFLHEHPDFHISINLSAADLSSGRTVSMLANMLERTGLPPQSFWVEATERGFLESTDVMQVIDDIRTVGLRVAIDDFGTGYSSLAFLSSFRLDVLKIDKRFVDAIGVAGIGTGDKVVTMVIDLARTLGLEVVAEGVETEAQAHFLRERGVQYAQGWLFGRPQSVDALRKLVAAWLPSQAPLATST